MKNLSYNAHLSSNDNTNHSIRHTCITTLDSKGFDARHIVAISGHKSETTIREYSVKCSENKQKQMYETLVDHMAPTTKIKPTSTVVRPVDSIITPPALPASDQNVIFAQTSVTNQQPANYTVSINYDIVKLKTENFDLLELTDTDNDDLLVKYLDDNERLLQEQTQQQQVVPRNQANVTNVQQNTYNPSIPVLPCMFFPNSTVTINYNFLVKNLLVKNQVILIYVPVIK